MYDAEEDRACLYDSVSGLAFGPVFSPATALPGGYSYDAREVAEVFLQLIVAAGSDPRVLSDKEIAAWEARLREVLNDRRATARLLGEPDEVEDDDEARP